jgi:hypothetical protein
MSAGVGSIVAILLLGMDGNLFLTLDYIHPSRLLNRRRFIGEFISAADATLIMATAGRISSEFGHLRDGSWLFTAYSLGLCAAQPMVSRANSGLKL